MQCRGDHGHGDIARAEIPVFCLDAQSPQSAGLREDAKKPFTTVEQMFDVLYKTNGDPNHMHIAMNRSKGLRMMKDFSSFWAKFQVFASELEHDESNLIIKPKHKLTRALFRAKPGGATRPTIMHQYAEHYQAASQEISDIDIRTSTPDSYNQYNCRNASTNSSANTSSKTITLASRSIDPPPLCMPHHPPLLPLSTHEQVPKPTSYVCRWRIMLDWGVKIVASAAKRWETMGYVVIRIRGRCQC